MPEAFLSEAIAELVDNALRFSNQGQSVTVTGTRLSSHYRIEVSDEGVGMSPEERAGVAPFTQFGRGKREQQGLGLGLSIVRSITRVASGEMSIEEGPGGRGLLVSLLLPLG
jgi:signal transduction histidine kinase